MCDALVDTKDIKDYKTLAKQLTAEFVGTFLYLFVASIAGCHRQELNDRKEFFIIETALTNGFVISAVIYSFSHISGGHFNPAITAGVLICRISNISIWRALLYVVVQILGAIFGSFLAYMLSVDFLRQDLGATVPHAYLHVAQVFCIELILSFLLVLLVLSVFDMRRNKNGLGLGALVIGLCVTGCQCGAFLFTASMNPVRSLGPAVMMNIWKHHEMYWLGPIAGGCAAGFLYRFVFALRKRSEYEDNNE